MPTSGIWASRRPFATCSSRRSSQQASFRHISKRLPTWATGAKKSSNATTRADEGRKTPGTQDVQRPSPRPRPPQRTPPRPAPRFRVGGRSGKRVGLRSVRTCPKRHPGRITQRCPKRTPPDTETSLGAGALCRGQVGGRFGHSIPRRVQRLHPCPRRPGRRGPGRRVRAAWRRVCRLRACP